MLDVTSGLDPGLYILFGTLGTGLFTLLTNWLGKRPSRVEASAQDLTNFQSVAAEMKELLKEKKADLAARDMMIQQRDTRIESLAGQLDGCRRVLARTQDVLAGWASEQRRQIPKLDEEGNP